MKRGYKRRVIVAFLIVLLVLVLAWWIGDGIYNPYPPATPTVTPGYWPTRVTATIAPSATPTMVVHTPIQPTIGYTATPYEPPVTATPTVLITIKNTATPMPLVYPIQKSIECERMIFKGRLTIYYPYCRIIRRRIPLTTRIPGEDDAIWWPPITTPPYTSIPFTGSPIFTP